MARAHVKTDRIERNPDGTYTGTWDCQCGDEFSSGPRGSELDALAASTTSWGLHLQGL